MTDTEIAILTKSITYGLRSLNFEELDGLHDMCLRHDFLKEVEDEVIMAIELANLREDINFENFDGRYGDRGY